jgi:hypothetical protein
LVLEDKPSIYQVRLVLGHRGRPHTHFEVLQQGYQHIDNGKGRKTYSADKELACHFLRG